MADHIKRAAEPIKDLPQDVRLNQLDHEDLTRAIVMEFLDSLLGGLPEEAIEAAEDPFRGDRESTEESLRRFLRSLRSGLERDGE